MTSKNQSLTTSVSTPTRNSILSQEGQYQIADTHAHTHTHTHAEGISVPVSLIQFEGFRTKEPLEWFIEYQTNQFPSP